MFSSKPNDHRRALLAVLALGTALVLLVRADQPNLAASDLSVPGPTLDTRPLEGGKPAPGDDPLPQEAAVASNETPDISMPGSNAEAAAEAAVQAAQAASAGPVPASIMAVATAGTDTSTPVIASSVMASSGDSISASASDPNAGMQLASSNGVPAPLTGATPTVSALPPSTNATVNLINLMVKRNLISQDDADGLIREAQQEADTARAEQATTSATAQRALVLQQSQPPPAPSKPATSEDDDEMRISYVPDVVKKQITDQVTQNVMEETREEHLADTISASQVPEWIRRIHLTGDVRVRYEGDYFPSGNATGEIVNYNAINTGSPFDVNQNSLKSGLIPTYNVDQDRNRFRLRARLGAGFDLGDGFTAGLRVATGSDDQPVSENQTLGGASGQGGNFSKYQIWLDRGFIQYDIGGEPDKDFSISVGRFDNPFFSTSMIWGDDIGFDGFMAKGKYQVATGVTPFLTAGAFPIFNTDLNFGTNSNVAGNGYSSEDKWLYAGQGGVNWTINKDFSFKGAVAFYDFENIQGQVSSPISQDDFSVYGTNVSGDTDDTRPSFAQHGNTYIALRNVQIDNGLANPTPIYEYFGLASKFQELALTGQLDYSHFDPFHMSLIGEFVDNLAFNRAGIEGEGPAILPGPQNNFVGSSYAGGGMGYDVRLNLGAPALQNLWDWNVSLAYRYLQSDAVVDAFNDSDFGGYLSGTNLKGYILGANLALSKRTSVSFRLMDADSISGPPVRVDTVQVDLNAKF